MAEKLKYYSDNARHLVCIPYSIANLHRMAEDLNIKRCWYHKSGRNSHYDIPKRRVMEIGEQTTVVGGARILEIIREGQNEE